MIFCGTAQDSLNVTLHCRIYIHRNEREENEILQCIFPLILLSHWHNMNVWLSITNFWFSIYHLPKKSLNQTFSQRLLIHLSFDYLKSLRVLSVCIITSSFLRVGFIMDIAIYLQTTRQLKTFWMLMEY